MYLWMRLSENFSYAWTYLWSGRVFAIALGIFFAFIAISLFVVSRTKWGQSKPITKCIVLAVLAHVWMLIYACSTRVVLPQGDPHGSRQSLLVSLDAQSLEPQVPEHADIGELQLPDASSVPWEAPLPVADLAAPELLQSPNVDQALANSLQAPELLPDLDPEPAPTDLLATQGAIKPEDPLLELLPESPVLPMPANPDVPPLASTVNAHQSPSPAAAPAAPPSDATMRPSSPPINSLPAISIPPEYQLRKAGNRLELARPFGADEDTEAAVAAALEWLANAQSPDGAWKAKQYGAGTETHALGENRRGTGDRADTGVTGLALLAFLSGGHTHLEGKHRVPVQKGLEYLIQSQNYSGDLSGPLQVGDEQAVVNARMYCHGIAALALAEAYAMTHDAALKPALVRAIQYTLDAQDKVGGGWRYRPGDPGDLSQFGWQAMALRSAERSGIAISSTVRDRMRFFLQSCSAGDFGGLARYKPKEGAPSTTMTAEAFACRLLLNMPHTQPAQTEAKRALISHPPGSEEDNVYYWYYATLALFQLQDTHWQTWNLALKKRLLDSQIPAYQTDGGSWKPDTLWGGYGGRVYQTAMSCMCLEVYYRYLPLYQPNQTAGAIPYRNQR